MMMMMLRSYIIHHTSYELTCSLISGGSDTMESLMLRIEQEEKKAAELTSIHTNSR